MLIPQGMAYAMIAGLPPVYGLYAALFPGCLCIYGHLASIGCGSCSYGFAYRCHWAWCVSLSGPQEYLALALFLAFFVGTIQLLMGFLKLGVFVHFLSRPVISGFTSAAAIIIG